MVLQTRGRRLEATWQVDDRRLRGRLALHGERRVLHRFVATYAGAYPHVPGPRELHREASAVVGCGRHVVLGRDDNGWGCGEGGPATQLAPGWHALLAHR